MPYFDQCLSRDSTIGVADLQKYTHLYENCANMDGVETGVLMADLNELMDNPKCRVNTTGIVARGGKCV